MNFTRRSLLKSSLGAAQVALLAKMGFTPKLAHAATTPPSRLLTIFFPGGWMPIDLFCPMSATEIARVIPAPTKHQNEPVFFTGAQVKNLDGTGDALAPNGNAKVRSPILWDAARLAAGMPDARTNGSTSPNGWSWVQHKLWENTCVVHGIDMGTAGHSAGAISAMCGIAGNDFRAPALHAHVANALYPKYGDSRPLPSVQMWEAPGLNSLNLRAEAAPISIYSSQYMGSTFDEGENLAWQGFRGRAPAPALDFNGAPIANLPVTALETHLTNRARSREPALAPTRSTGRSTTTTRASAA
jgi:hypothetical protein